MIGKIPRSLFVNLLTEIDHFSPQTYLTHQHHMGETPEQYIQSNQNIKNKCTTTINSILQPHNKIIIIFIVAK